MAPLFSVEEPQAAPSPASLTGPVPTGILLATVCVCISITAGATTSAAACIERNKHLEMRTQKQCGTRACVNVCYAR